MPPGGWDEGVYEQTCSGCTGGMPNTDRLHDNLPTSSTPGPKVMRKSSSQIRYLHYRFSLGFDGLAVYKFLISLNSLERT